MKNFIILLFITAATAMLCSCLKGTGNPAPATLNGNWQLVNDSTIGSTCGMCAIVNNVGINYVGQPGDHFNFTANGILYIKEAANFDTASYALKQDTVLLGYNGTGLRPVYLVSNFTANTLKLTGGTSLAPGIIYTHIINLKK